jgi:transcriptional regulator with XRE-family HTH domain
MAEQSTKFLHGLGQRMLELRKEQGLTQGQLAELLSISQQLMAFYEKGQRRVPIDLLPKVARLLGVSVEELLGLTTAATPKRGPTPKLQQQLERLSRLPHAKQRFVSEMLEMVLQQASR